VEGNCSLTGYLASPSAIPHGADGSRPPHPEPVMYRPITQHHVDVSMIPSATSQQSFLTLAQVRSPKMQQTGWSRSRTLRRIWLNRTYPSNNSGIRAIISSHDEIPSSHPPATTTATTPATTGRAPPSTSTIRRFILGLATGSFVQTAVSKVRKYVER